jgi:hypothetical protein
MAAGEARRTPKGFARFLFILLLVLPLPIFALLPLGTKNEGE